MKNVLLALVVSALLVGCATQPVEERPLMTKDEIRSLSESMTAILCAWRNYLEAEGFEIVQDNRCN